MRQAELLEIIANGEMMPVPRTDMSSLDDARLLNYYRDIIKDPEVPQTLAEWERRLLGSGIRHPALCNVSNFPCSGKWSSVDCYRHPDAFCRQQGETRGENMIRHIVMFNWKAGTPESIKDEVLEGFAHMKNTIEHVIHMECGNDQNLMEGNYDFVMLADFSDKESWLAYRGHPEHLAFVQKFGMLSAEVARIQIEI